MHFLILVLEVLRNSFLFILNILVRHWREFINFCVHCFCWSYDQQRNIMFKHMHTFSLGLWKGVNKVLPHVQIHGCSFHWNQAIWKRVSRLGLASAYYKKESTYRYIKMLMALPFLPHEHIADAFQQLSRRAGSEALNELVEYIKETWIENQLWEPSTWTVFMRAHRTNNDCEGWHRRLNSICNNTPPPLYVLVRHLHEEVQHLNVQIKLLSHGKLKRRQKTVHKNKQYKIFELWNKYTANEISTSQLLKCISLLNSPLPED